MIQTLLKEVGIEYPNPNETISRGPYSFRVCAPSEASEVRISIDDGPWQQCRAENGHWWYDWSADFPGDHVAVTRVIEKDGALILSQPRLFKVEG